VRPHLRAAVLEAQARKREGWENTNKASVAHAKKQKRAREAEALVWLEEVKARRKAVTK
jgi:hypothetical protein